MTKNCTYEPARKKANTGFPATGRHDYELIGAELQDGLGNQDYYITTHGCICGAIKTVEHDM